MDGGLWSTYWYNGATFGSELTRGFDAYGLTPADDLSENEIEAASSHVVERLNAQNHRMFDWEPSFAVVRSFRDQLVRAGNVVAKTEAFIDKFIDRAEAFLARNKLQPARASYGRSRTASTAPVRRPAPGAPRPRGLDLARLRRRGFDGRGQP